jgi:hypothetical protein
MLSAIVFMITDRLSVALVERQGTPFVSALSPYLYLVVGIIVLTGLLHQIRIFTDIAIVLVTHCRREFAVLAAALRSLSASLRSRSKLR